jgi:uncharacterized membrane protein YgcG
MKRKDETKDEESARIRREWGTPDAKRRMPHQDLVDPRLIYFIGDLPRRKHIAFVGLLDYAKRRHRHPDGQLVKLRLENFIMTSPALDAENRKAIVEVLREHIVGQKEGMGSPKSIGSGSSKGGGGSGGEPAD